MKLGSPGARWAMWRRLVIHKKGDPDDVYLDRLRIVQTPWLGLYLHRIPRPDGDRDPHDHPWWFASMVLRGWYEEDRYYRPNHLQLGTPNNAQLCYAGNTRRRRFSVHMTPLFMAHRITNVPSDGSLLTLVLVGPRRRQWGFWPGLVGWIPWTDYEHTGAEQESYAK